MLKQAYDQGLQAAQEMFKVGLAMPGGAFLKGQWGAAKGLVNDLRGGFGGNLHAAHGLPQGPLTPEMTQVMRAQSRQNALGNLKTLAPSLAGAGALGLGAYALSGPSDEERQQRAMQQAMMMR